MKKNKSSPLHGHKTLLEALEATDVSTTQAKKYLKDSRLTQGEKKLVQHIIQMRVSDFSFIDELSKNDAYDTLPFLLGLKHLILGAVYIYRCESLEGERHLKLAMPHISACKNVKFVNRMVFKVHANLFFNYVNQKRFPDMERQFKLTEKLKKNTSDEHSFMIMEACYHSMTGDYGKAEEVLEQIHAVRDQLNDFQAISYRIEAFDLYVKLELFNKAAAALQEMKKLKTFRLSATYQYSSKLLNFLTKDERIYVYERDFLHGKDLFAMIKVISSLDEGNEEEAKLHWSKLSELSPLTYQENFRFEGDKCLFSLSLNKCLNRNTLNTPRLTGNYTEQEKAFIDSFINKNLSTIKKEDLFRAIYGKELDSKEALAALAMLVFRINKKGEIQFKSKKGAYFLIDLKSESA